MTRYTWLGAVGMLATGCAFASPDAEDVGRAVEALPAAADEVIPQLGVHGDPLEPNVLTAFQYNDVALVRAGFSGAHAAADGTVDARVYDGVVRAHAERGIHILPILQSGTSGATVDFARWERFTESLARRYGPGGTFWAENPDVPPLPIRAWEIWNEPNLMLFWGGTPPDPVQYRRVLRHAFIGLRRGDPRARVVFGGLSFPNRRTAEHIPLKPFVREVLDGGSEEVRDHNRCLFDAIAVHPYAESVRGTVRRVRQVRDFLADEGLSGRDPDRDVQIWITEVGWGVADACEADLPAEQCTRLTVADESAQERVLTRDFAALRDRAGRFRLGPVLWYTFEDIPVATGSMGACTGPQKWACFSGLWRDHGLNPRPAWRALGIAASRRTEDGRRPRVARLPPVRCSFDAAQLDALAQDDLQDGGGR